MMNQQLDEEEARALHGFTERNNYSIERIWRTKSNVYAELHRPSIGRVKYFYYHPKVGRHYWKKVG